MEVQIYSCDAGPFRGLAETLRGEPERAARLRVMLGHAFNDKDTRCPSRAAFCPRVKFKQRILSLVND